MFKFIWKAIKTLDNRLAAGINNAIIKWNHAVKETRVLAAPHLAGKSILIAREEQRWRLRAHFGRLVFQQDRS